MPLQVHNEADLASNNACMDPSLPAVAVSANITALAMGLPAGSLTPGQYVDMYWADFLSVRSTAAQDSYTDANADVAAGRMACPVGA